jgi:hypothetical protein
VSYIESQFEYTVGAKTVRFSHSDFGLVVQALHDAAGADGLEILAKQIAQPELLVGAKVLTATEQQPAGFPEDRGAALKSQRWQRFPNRDQFHGAGGEWRRPLP